MMLLPSLCSQSIPPFSFLPSLPSNGPLCLAMPRINDGDNSFCFFTYIHSSCMISGTNPLSASRNVEALVSAPIDSNYTSVLPHISDGDYSASNKINCLAPPMSSSSSSRHAHATAAAPRAWGTPVNQSRSLMSSSELREKTEIARARFLLGSADSAMLPPTSLSHHIEQSRPVGVSGRRRSSPCNISPLSAALSYGIRAGGGGSNTASGASFRRGSISSSSSAASSPSSTPSSTPHPTPPPSPPTGPSKPAIANPLSHMYHRKQSHSSAKGSNTVTGAASGVINNNLSLAASGDENWEEVCTGLIDMFRRSKSEFNESKTLQMLRYCDDEQLATMGTCCIEHTYNIMSWEASSGASTVIEVENTTTEQVGVGGINSDDSTDDEGGDDDDNEEGKHSFPIRFVDVLLLLACRNGHLSMARLLLARGADTKSHDWVSHIYN
jgi:hypothetical protein